MEIMDATAQGWIVDDDGGANTSYYFITDAALAEGDSGTTPVTFTVRRLGNTTAPGSVQYTCPRLRTTTTRPPAHRSQLPSLRARPQNVHG